ncbi:MAG: Nuclease [Candidatus Omnitrophica bacterium]|nr:Nuclease [Candidatus Omnitrophota bacterium]
MRSLPAWTAWCLRAVTLGTALFLAGCAGWGWRPASGPGEAVRPRVVDRQEWESEKAHLRYGYPSLDGRFVYRPGYVLCADPQTKNARWIAFSMSATPPPTPDPKRVLRPDPELLKGERSETIDYENRAYVAGLLVPETSPAEGPAAMTERAYLSVRAPLDPSVAASLWPSLLDRVRTIGRGREVRVCVGPVYLGELQWIGPSRVAVPSHVFAVAQTGSAADGDLTIAAFMVPNAPYSPIHLDRFAVSVDHIENLTDLDFLPDLEDGLESAVESQWPT